MNHGELVQSISTYCQIN